jgi:hypothetical protein
MLERLFSGLVYAEEARRSTLTIRHVPRLPVNLPPLPNSNIGCLCYVPLILYSGSQKIVAVRFVAVISMDRLSSLTRLFLNRIKEQCEIKEHTVP